MSLLVVLACAFLLAVVLGACGSSNSASSGASTPDAAKLETKSGSAGAKEYLTKVQDESQVDFPSFMPPDSPSVAKGKKIAVILNGSGAEGAVRASEGMKTAGSALGWTIEVTDGQFDPNVQSQGITSAVNKQVDGIVLDSIAPVTVGGAVQKALAAKIPIVTTFDPGSSKEVPGVFGDASNGTFDGGLALGAWIAVNSNGKGRIVNVPDTSLPLTQQRAAGVKAGIEKFCPTCKVLATHQNDIAAMATKLPSQASADVSRFGTKNLYMVAPFDAAATFLIQGAKDAKAPKFPIVSMDGNKDAIKAIADGNYLATTWAAAAEWMGWAALDQMNRAFNNAQPAGKSGDATVPSLLIDKSNLPTKGGDWSPSFDYQSAYKKLWGLN
jgi:ABC-type sugar transport system substrate-binding protein